VICEKKKGGERGSPSSESSKIFPFSAKRVNPRTRQLFVRSAPVKSFLDFVNSEVGLRTCFRGFVYSGSESLDFSVPLFGDQWIPFSSCPFPRNFAYITYEKDSRMVVMFHGLNEFEPSRAEWHSHDLAAVIHWPLACSLRGIICSNNWRSEESKKGQATTS